MNFLVCLMDEFLFRQDQTVLACNSVADYTLALVLSSAYPAMALGPVWTNICNGLTGVIPGVSQLLVDSSGSTFYSLTTGGLFKNTKP